MKWILTVIALCALGISMPLQLTAQDYERVTEIDVFNDGNQLLSPWTGGLNAPQIAEADFNNDGRTDLFFYDEDGEWVYIFIHLENDTYIYEPSYAEGFPDIRDWVLMDDYNCDGITDMIMHGTRGSPQTYLGYYEDNRLRFTGDKSIIYYQTPTGFSVNLYTIGTHRPALRDVNGDGDLDFLAYDVSLFRISYYENQRVEDNLPCDSLYYRRLDRCWGTIKEAGITLDQTLGDTCDFRFGRMQQQAGNPARHPGGTALALYDEDKNGVFDLFLSDFTFSRMNFLRNNGTAEVSNLYAQDDSFPSYDQFLDISVFPAPHLIDVDKDGDEDMLAAPFNAGAVDNYMNVSYYKNNGTDFEPFRFESDNFVVGDMIDVGETASPALFDYNNDGLMDIVIGNGGYFEDGGTYTYSLTLYENTGTETLPAFTFTDRDYLDMSTFEFKDMTPFFADLDGDTDKDFIAGELGGKVLVMTNSGASFINLAFLEDNLGADIDIGQSSHPVLFDLDGNGTLDLIIGTRDGNLVYYENTGTANNAEFTFRTDTLGGVRSHPDNSLIRYSSPAFGDFDNDGNQDLILGGADSRVKFYSNIGTDYNSVYTLTDGNYFNVSRFDFTPGNIYPRLNPAVADISDDGKAEVILGTNTGGLMLYSQDLSDTTDLASNYQVVNDLVSLWPNPAVDRIDIEWGKAFGQGGKLYFTLTDIVGRTLTAKEIHNEGRLQISLQSLPAGMYSATLQKDRSIGTVRFVKH